MTNELIVEKTIRESLVKQVLPEFWSTDYPNIITFIETYYDFMDSDGQFGADLNDLYEIRNIGTTKLAYLDNMFEEFALGMGQEFFSEPREVLRNFAKFFRVKGSLYSAKGFFRSFYSDDTAEITYPKSKLFMVGDSYSIIGPNSTKILQDGGVYQVLSILIKSKTSLGKYEDFYRKFVHPSGFHLAAEMQIDTQADVTIQSIEPIAYVDPDLDIDSSLFHLSAKTDMLGCFQLANTGNMTTLETTLTGTAYDSSNNIELGNGDVIEWGVSYDGSLSLLPGDGKHDLISTHRVNSKHLTALKSVTDEYFYALADRHDPWSTLSTQDFCFHSEAPLASADSFDYFGNSLVAASGADRQRIIMEFVYCDSSEMDSNYINTKYDIRSVNLNDVKGKTALLMKDALI